MHKSSNHKPTNKAKTGKAHLYTMLRRGQVMVVQSFSDKKIASKLLSIGILPGTKVKIIRKVIGGGVYYIMADNLRFALRKKELLAIQFESISDGE